MFSSLATLTLAVHALWILWMLTGALLPSLLAGKGRGWGRLRIAYLASVALTLVFAFSTGGCPLTDIENEFERRAGSAGGYEGGFIHHYLSEFVYVGNNFETVAGLQMILITLLAIAILINIPRLRF